MKVLQDFPEVQSINIIHGYLNEFSNTKRFVYLSDGVARRKYVIAEVKLFFGKEVSVIEVEREDKAISSLICFLSNQKINDYYHNILIGLIENHGNWSVSILEKSEIRFLTLRHGKRQPKHRAGILMKKLLLV
ncbi:Tn7-like element transposition protein TnsE [Lysinibacillus sphaericus]|uniref:Tn7-like element transposition protein TnsE n=1 Tax=Lysinibacillus sphaericus TaxID=1421 RepID=UPI000A79A302|nr:Tn7-like element transposition protein TnsE [Lysinibacillus sphaericus]